LVKSLRFVTAAVIGAIVAVGCGGQSEFHPDDGDGTSGSAGTGEGGTAGGAGGTSGVGASPSGGFGASPSGGIGGTSPTGGVGMAPSGGMGATSPTGGVGVGGSAGTGGSSGAGGICSLPLDPGPCDAAIPAFGFSKADGNCQPFIYGGCQGNENRFSTLAECEATCGGSLSDCPERTPWDDACADAGQVCTYDFDDCLCAPKQPYECAKIDRQCVRPPLDGGVQEIIAVVYVHCACGNASSSSGGTWTCRNAAAD
jgi:hypothetical protein